MLLSLRFEPTQFCGYKNSSVSTSTKVRYAYDETEEGRACFGARAAWNEAMIRDCDSYADISSLETNIQKWSGTASGTANGRVPTLAFWFLRQACSCTDRGRF